MLIFNNHFKNKTVITICHNILSHFGQKKELLFDLFFRYCIQQREQE